MKCLICKRDLDLSEFYDTACGKRQPCKECYVKKTYVHRLRSEWKSRAIQTKKIVSNYTKVSPRFINKMLADGYYIRRGKKPLEKEWVK